MTKSPKPNTRKTKSSKSQLSNSETLPFIEHIRELRRRVFYVVASVIVWTVAAYFVQEQIIAALMKPAHGQHFIYTSPIGGVDFFFRVILYVGLMMTIPVAVYQLLTYLAPLMKQASARFAFTLAAVSGLLAAAGIVFGYFVGLPAVLDFLLSHFQVGNIRPLLTVQSYIKFVTVYMLGSALMFQVPLVILFINRIKPLKPQTLFKGEKWVIAGSFIFAGLMNPSPNIFSLLFVAGPIIITYQIGIALVWFLNRQKKLGKIEKLRVEDARVQAQRQQRAARPERTWPTTTAAPETSPQTPPTTPPRPDNVVRARYIPRPVAPPVRRQFISDIRAS
jgi:sec-independent protein translocase protein TatC